MYKKNIFCIILFLLVQLCSLPLIAQSTEEKEVISTIEQLFEGMREGDTLLLEDLFAPNAQLLTVIEKADEVSLQEVSLDRFMAAVASPHEEIWDERITSYEIKIDDRLASAWTPYEFYLGKNFSHCGVNAFQLYKDEEGWKILVITDTRRLENCP
ncbi:nuclear transport factor 2 family protein [Catalinimonas sp. 4WD22]|uniref:nuclear transport factor 2 family protein n=1 Tax=Catalinimonas locisalis TaxID=3133978 RepID=UPI0031014797